MDFRRTGGGSVVATEYKGGGILKTDCQWERIIRILQSPMGGSGTFY